MLLFVGETERKQKNQVSVGLQLKTNRTSRSSIFISLRIVFLVILMDEKLLKSPLNLYLLKGILTLIPLQNVFCLPNNNVGKVDWQLSFSSKAFPFLPTSSWKFNFYLSLRGKDDIHFTFWLTWLSALVKEPWTNFELIKCVLVRERQKQTFLLLRGWRKVFLLADQLWGKSNGSRTFGVQGTVRLWWFVSCRVMLGTVEYMIDNEVLGSNYT